MPSEIACITYSHSDFADILKVHRDNISFQKHILFINKPTPLADLYDQVVYYDDSQPYAARLVQCLSHLKDIEYAFLIHDIDIVLTSEHDLLNGIPTLMQKNGIRRVDLQRYIHPRRDELPLIDIHTGEVFANIASVTEPNHVFMVHDRFGDFPYTVNPSIWHLPSLLSLLSNFQSLHYRTIEVCQELQAIVRNQYLAQKIYSIERHDRRCGFFHCTPLFTFFHITHGGQLVNLKWDDTQRDSHWKYSCILEKYGLVKSGRGWYVY